MLPRGVSNITVCTVLLQLQLCKRASVFKFKINVCFFVFFLFFFALKLFWCLCSGLLVTMLVSKGSTACDYWLGALAYSLDLAVFKSFGLSTAVCV